MGGRADRQLTSEAGRTRGPRRSEHAPGDAGEPWRKHLVPQRHAEYTDEEHETWRRLVSRTAAVVSEREARLHPDFVDGFQRLVRPWTQIPRLEELSASLAEFGWRTLCVGGYLPPQVYSAMVAEGIFPVSREIRRVEHLEFSPTPDLAHDLIGHVPMLVCAQHRHFLQRLARATTEARSNRADRELYLANRSMAALRCRPSTHPSALGAALTRVDAAQRGVAAEPSELARLDRMYLWSVEFGLMGTPDDYRLYGAGLLSSLAETDAMFNGQARVIPFSEAALERSIEFSDPQNVYFVARDYEQLNDALTSLVDPPRSLLATRQ